MSLALDLVAAQREPQRLADFLHTRRTQLRHALSQFPKRNDRRVVQIDRARRFHAVFLAQHNFGRRTADRRCDRRNRHRAEQADDALACQYYDRLSLVRRSEFIQPDVAARYSAGRTASRSHR